MSAVHNTGTSRMKPKWERQPCGCVKTRLSGERFIIRCLKHRGKPSKRTLGHFDEDGIVRRG